MMRVPVGKATGAYGDRSTRGIAIRLRRPAPPYRQTHEPRPESRNP